MWRVLLQLCSVDGSASWERGWFQSHASGFLYLRVIRAGPGCHKVLNDPWEMIHVFIPGLNICITSLLEASDSVVDGSSMD